MDKPNYKTDGGLAFTGLQSTFEVVETSTAYSGYSNKQRAFILASYSSESRFKENIWLIDKKEPEMQFPTTVRRLRFGEFPSMLRNEVKDWVLNLLQVGRKLKGINSSLNDLKSFLGSIDGKHIYEISEIDILDFYDSLMSEKLSDSTIYRRWSVVHRFFLNMGCNKQEELMSKYIVPKWENRKIATKYIPDEAVKRMDSIFKGTEIPLTYRCIYWTLRLFPNRIEEVVSIHIDALAKVSDNAFILSIPISKTAGNYEQPEQKQIKILYEGMGKYYVDLLYEQATYTKENMPESKFLFVSRKVCFKKNIITKEYGYEETGQKVYPVHEKMVQSFFWRFAPRFNIKDEQGEFVAITTHKFRHNAVTERLNSGIFKRIDVMYLTGHKNTMMLDENYAHAEPPKPLPIEFRGKITDDTKRVTAMLARPFAKEIYHLGVCSDNRDCNSGRIACLTCKYLRVDTDQISFMRRDRADWEKKYVKASVIGNEPFAALCRRWIDAYDTLFAKIKEDAYETRTNCGNEEDV